MDPEDLKNCTTSLGALLKQKLAQIEKNDVNRAIAAMHRVDSLDLSKIKERVNEHCKKILIDDRLRHDLVAFPSHTPRMITGLSEGFYPYPLQEYQRKIIRNPCDEVFLKTYYREGIPTQPQHKESQMDISKLVALADPTWEKDMKELGILSDSVAAEELRAEIARQSEEQRANATKQAATEILALGRHVVSHKESLVSELRRIRALEKDMLKRIAAVEEAWAYGSKTLNYLPVALATGAVYHHSHHFDGLNRDLLKVQPLPEAEVAKAE